MNRTKAIDTLLIAHSDFHLRLAERGAMPCVGAGYSLAQAQENDQ